jgi:hypothetical protein
MTIFLGLLGIQVIAAVWSFFYGLSQVWTLCLCLFSFSAYVFHFRSIQDKAVTSFYTILDKNTGKSSLRSTLSRKRVNLSLFLTAAVGIAYVASGAPYFIDNESYYIQTIKWLDEYGLVKGLSNLHLFLSQQSGFHILQSALNFDFFYDRFNDLSGFYLLVGFGWSLQSNLQDSPILKGYRQLYAVLFILGYLFSTVPSPDLPVYVISYIVVYYFLQSWEVYKEAYVVLISLLIMQVAFIKVTATLLALLPLILMFKERSLSLIWRVKTLGIGILFIGLYVSKSYVINGLPFYPLTTWSPIEVSWQLPQELAVLYKELTFSQSFGVYYQYLDQYDLWQRLGLWWNYKGIEGFFNKATAVLLSIQLILMFLSRVPQSFKVVLGVSLLQSTFLLATSPQFRFFVNLLFPAAALIWLLFVPQSRKLGGLIAVLCLIAGFAITVQTDLKNMLTDNALMKSSAISNSHWVVPLENSKKKVAYKRVEKESFYHYSLEDGNFLFSTYDVPIPAVQEALLEWVAYEYRYEPQMLDEDLSDGFKSVPVD